MYPDKGQLARKNYPKHLEFFRLGKDYNERALLGGNRSGKSFAGLFEDVCHTTGKYPSWWEGRRFEHPINAWICGDIGKTLRDILQTGLLGPAGQPDLLGTGLLPEDCIMRTTPRLGTPDAVESIFVKHSSGGVSTIQFKAYEQGRAAFQGTSQHVIHLDEECDLSIYTECLLRTMTVNGLVYLTATPLLGLTEIMLAFLPEMNPIAEGPLEDND